MFVKDIRNCKYFKAIDETTLCELLHPDKEVENLKMNYSIAHAIIKPGESSKPHKLKTSSEIYYILEGTGTIFISDESLDIHPGQAIYIPPNSRQYIQNKGISDLKFLCIVHPPWNNKDEEVE